MRDTVPERVQISDSVLYHALDGGIVLLNMTSEQYYGLDDIGKRMWELLLELGNVTEVVERLAAEFDVDRARLQADLAVLVDKLMKAGLLSPASDRGK